MFSSKFGGTAEVLGKVGNGTKPDGADGVNGDGCGGTVRVGNATVIAAEVIE